MAASSEHEFEGRVSGGIFRCRHVCIQENLNDVTRSPNIQKSTWPRLGTQPKWLRAL